MQRLLLLLIFSSPIFLRAQNVLLNGRYTVEKKHATLKEILEAAGIPYLLKNEASDIDSTVDVSLKDVDIDQLRHWLEWVFPIVCKISQGMLVVRQKYLH